MTAFIIALFAVMATIVVLFLFGFLFFVVKDAVMDSIDRRRLETEFREFMRCKKERINKLQEDANRSKNEGQQDC
jgi:hypothetical protein